jgi:hypothetical protein
MCTIGPRAVLAVLVLSGTHACLAQAPRRAERPDVGAGEAAEYRDLTVRTGEKRDTTFVVTAVDADKIVSEMSASTSGTRTFTRDYNLVENKTGELVALLAKPQWPYFQFPLTVDQGNQSWTGSQKETAWYAPESDRTAKRDYEQAAPSRNFLDHQVIELLSFKAAS